MRKSIMFTSVFAATMALSACGPKAEEPAADTANTAATTTDAAAPAADAAAKPADAMAKPADTKTADEPTDESHTGGEKIKPGG